MEITEMSDTDLPAWDAYVQDSVHGLPYHLSGWRDVLSKTYGYKTHFLMATEGERLMGVIPLFIVRSRLVGSRAMTMLGGLCAEDDQVAQALIDQGIEIARQAAVGRLVLQDTRQAWPGNLHTTSEHVHWIVDIRMGSEVLWKELHKNIRRQVRIGRKNELRVEIDRTGDLVGDLYKVLSCFTHRVGTPLFGRNFLENVVQTFPGGFNIAVVYKEQKPVGAYFQLEMGNTVYGAWGATLHEYLRERATYLAYWEMLNDAAMSGFEFLDMGRSPADTSVSKFKRQWGGVSRPIHQQVAAVAEDQAIESVTERVQSNTMFKLFVRLWPKLPVSVAQFLGPRLRRQAPFA
jgi:FemAB-related protein (PEP-CTERM system-associated)